MKRLYIFDMDGTLIPQTTGMLEIAKIMGHLEQLSSLETLYYERKIDSLQFAKEIYDLWIDLTPQIVEKAFTQAPKLNNIHKALNAISNRKDVSCLITTAPQFFADHFKSFGFDYIFASNPFDLTARLFDSDAILNAKDKPIVAKQLCHKLGLNFDQSIAFGDSVSDIPLFERLQHTISVNGNEALKDYAMHHYVGNDLEEALQLAFKIV